MLPIRLTEGVSPLQYGRARDGVHVRGRPCKRSCARRSSSLRPLATSSPTPGVSLGPVELAVPLGIGCWSWGNTSFWNDSWTVQDEQSARAAYKASLDCGISFFDTAEAYNGPENKNSFLFAQGAESSEELLGRMIREEGRGTPIICTKFSALPWRLGSQSVVEALKASLERLGVDSVDAYMIHWPGVWQNEAYADGLAEVVELGLAKSVGVSNHSVDQMRAASNILARRGVPLSFNQVQYSLLYQNVEENGMLEAVKELDMVLMAYSPLAMGLLTGKYSSDNPPRGARGQLYQPVLEHLDPLLAAMSRVGEAHDGKSITQVALNYLIGKGNVMPIPGAKSAAHADEFAGALGWSLSEDEALELQTTARELRETVKADSAAMRFMDGALKSAGL